MRRLLAEFLGTYVLVFAGTGAIVIDQLSHNAVTHVGIAITFGLAVMSMIYAFGDVSGAHLNPAVSIAFAVAGRFAVSQMAPYVLSQLAGACLASVTLKLIFPDSQILGATMPSGTEMQSFLMELMLTFILMLVIISVASGSKERGMFAGIAIGAVVGLEAMFAGPVSGASMNPARSFAPAVISGHLEHLWIYLVAPVAGAVAAVPVFRIIKQK